MKIDEERMKNVVAPLLGMSPWRAELGHGTSLGLDFGQQIPLSEGGGRRAHGEWHLMTYDCAWRLEKRAELIAGSGDRGSIVVEAVERLRGKPLDSFRVVSPLQDVELTFRGGFVLRLMPVSSEEDEHWMLFAPGGRVLALGPGSAWHYKEATVA